MRILIVSDIHGNSAALEAIREDYDVCLCLGDLVDYGPDPCAAVAWAREHATYIVRGNHDHGVAQNVPVRGEHGYRYLARTTRVWTRDILAEADRQYLAQNPVSHYVRLGDKRFFLVHAIPQDPLDTYLMPNRRAWARQVADVHADYICVGHTHLQFALEIRHKTVINPGSVGQPRDGKWQAAYAVMVDGRLAFKRAAYPLQRTLDQVQAMDVPARARQLATEALTSGGACLHWRPGHRVASVGVE